MCGLANDGEILVTQADQGGRIVIMERAVPQRYKHGNICPSPSPGRRSHRGRGGGVVVAFANTPMGPVSNPGCGFFSFFFKQNKTINRYVYVILLRELKLMFHFLNSVFPFCIII